MAEAAEDEKGPLRLALASRGDQLTEPLAAALSARYTGLVRIDAEMRTFQRLVTAAITWRPTRRRWVEQFYKSSFAFDMRSRQCSRELARVRQPVDVVVQVHAMFAVRDVRYVVYVDCTHRQVAKDWPPWNPLRGRALRRWYEREQSVYDGADHVFALATETRDSLVTDYGLDPARVSVVGAGSNFRELPRIPSRSASNRPPTVLFVGNDFVRKGGEVLLEAFGKVRAQLPAAELKLVGTRHRIAPQPGVEVLGRLWDRDRLAELYESADLFVLPSFFEPFGLVLLEAMAHALPCVGTHTCGTSEIVTDGETGLLVEAGDAEALADAMVRLLKSRSEAMEMGMAGRHRVEQYFQWQHVVERMNPAVHASDLRADSPR